MRPSHSRLATVLLAWCSIASWSCTGSIGTLSSEEADPSQPGIPGDPGHPGDPSHPGDPDQPGDPGEPSDPGAPRTGAPFDPSQCRPPPSRVVRLSRLELQNSMVDLLATKRTLELAEDAKFLNFSTNAQALVTPPFGNSLRSTAEALAADFRAGFDPSELGSSCSSGDAAARTCAATFVETFGQRAFRRPLADAEREQLLAVYDAGRETGADGNALDRLKAGLDYTLRAILQSPSFVYRTELGDPGTVANGEAALTPHEVAASLSYLLTASPPDAPLLEAAARNELDSPAALEEHARRLVSALPDRFAAQQRRFVREWLAIDLGAPAWDKNQEIYPIFSPDLKSAIDQETNLFLDDWVAEGPTLAALFTRSDTFVNAKNAPLYGLTATSSAMTKVSLDPAKRAGILTMPAFLGTLAHTDSSSPILRGVAIVRGVMCLTIQPPPPNVPQLPPVTDTSFTTTRDRVEKHVAPDGCMACHGRINPLGYPFESYDGLGAYRTQENGYDIDSSGAIVGTKASDRPVGSAVELTRALADSPEVQVCFARQVFRSAFGRQETAPDECSVRAAVEAYQSKELDMRELLVSFVKSETFARRSQ